MNVTRSRRGGTVLSLLLLLSTIPWPSTAAAGEEDDGGAAATAPARTALVHIQATVEQAQVKVNGRNVGPTPVDVRVPAGVVEILVEADGYEPYERSITAHAGEELSVTGVLKQIDGTRLHLVLPAPDNRIRVTYVAGKKTETSTYQVHGVYHTSTYLVDAWVDLCGAPCDRWVARDARLRIQGEGIHASQTFDLPAARDVTVRVTRVGSSARFHTGMILTGIGGGFGGLGLLIGGIFVAGRESEHVRVPGLALLGVGVVGIVVLVWGVSLIKSAKTLVDVEQGPPRLSLYHEGGVNIALSPAGIEF